MKTFWLGLLKSEVLHKWRIFFNRISPKCKGNNIFFHLVHYIKKKKYQGHFNQCLKLEILAMETKCFGTLGSFYRFVFHDPLSMFWGGWGFWCWMVGEVGSRNSTPMPLYDWLMLHSDLFSLATEYVWVDWRGDDVGVFLQAVMAPVRLPWAVRPSTLCFGGQKFTMQSRCMVACEWLMNRLDTREWIRFFESVWSSWP